MKIKNYKVTHTFLDGEKRDNLDGFVLKYTEETAHIFDFIYMKIVENLKNKKKETIDKTEKIENHDN